MKKGSGFRAGCPFLANVGAVGILFCISKFSFFIFAKPTEVVYQLPLCRGITLPFAKAPGCTFVTPQRGTVNTDCDAAAQGLLKFLKNMMPVADLGHDSTADFNHLKAAAPPHSARAKIVDVSRDMTTL